jgi:class 3 adenylate cyclase
MRVGKWLAITVAPLAVFALLLVRPSVDESWENHPAHFWLVLGAALLATTLAWGVMSAARRRRDARLFLISLAFIASASFLGLHALATPGVLLGKNPGFELATPVGLVLAGVFAAAAAIELDRRRADVVLRAAPLLVGVVATVVIVWAVFSLAGLPPLDDPLAKEQLDGWQLLLASVGVALFGAAAFGFLRIHRRREERFVLAFALAFSLLAEAMVVIAWARNWQISWWEWHVLMVGSFVLIAFVSRAEWHEERFSALYLDETLAGAKDVSILLADLAGFTSYSERHDADEVAAMLNTYFGRLAPLLERAGGEVHQIAGDEIMVVFDGAENTPDHALRAAAAGLAFQRTAARIAEEHDDWPRFRLGVNTGEVHAGVVGGARGHRKYGYVGDVVNVAARLQSKAPVDGVFIGQETFGRLGARAVVEPVPPLRVKGKGEPVVAFLLHRVDRGELGTSDGPQE